MLVSSNLFLGSSFRAPDAFRDLVKVCPDFEPVALSVFQQFESTMI
jgi:hypothetical protein